MASKFGIAEQFRFGQKLRESCDKDGNETDPQTAAKLLYQIGLIHRERSPDKISLIQSVGLFNAAIVRNPLNISQVKSDLFEVCQHILQLANANNQKKDLVEKAEDVKTSVIKLRQNVIEIVQKCVPKIPLIASEEQLAVLRKKKICAVQKLNEMIATEYSKIMAKVNEFCEDILGTPPCEYAVVGLGSLATQTITPYSDFEHMILLEDHCINLEFCLEYFRWYSTIFHVVILNLQETIIPALNILSLNGSYSAEYDDIITLLDEDVEMQDWYCDSITPQGISFDGMLPHACKFPLGRTQLTKNKPWTTELIKPVTQMLKYLSSEEDLKNGYHLADILKSSCFVFGKKNIFQQYEDAVKELQFAETSSKDFDEKHLHQEDFFRFVKEGLQHFSVRTILFSEPMHAFNVMKIYRSTTLFISALGKINKISTNSSFGIIEELAKRNKISTSTTNKVRLSVAIACEIRLKVFTENKSWISICSDETGQNNERFSHFVGAADAISYFQIAYCLQCEVAKQLNMNCLYTDPHQLNVLICSGLQMPEVLKLSGPNEKHFFKISEFDFDNYIKQLEAEIQLNPSKFERLRRQFFKNLELKIIELVSLYGKKLSSAVPNTSSFANYKPPHQSNKFMILPSHFNQNSSAVFPTNRTSLGGTTDHSSLYRKMLSTVLALHFLKKFSNYISSPFIKKSRTIIPNFRLKPDQVTSIAKHLHSEVVL